MTINTAGSATKLTKMNTYAETRGYLANAPGFGKRLEQYIEEPDSEPEPPPPEPKVLTTTPKSTEPKSGVYRKVDDRQDGPKYVPSTELPEQYKNSRWQCHSCNSVNTPEKGKCHMCGTQRGEKTIYLEGSDAPKTDWTCSSCKVVNATQRDNCVMCGTKYRPPAPTPVKGMKTPQGGPAGDKKKKPAAAPGVVPKKKAIVTKAGAGIELQYAKGMDNLAYRAGSHDRPGHGAGY